MTVGSTTQGNAESSYYYTKSWSGGDGKYSSGVLQQHAYTMTCTRHTSSKGIKPSGVFISPGYGLYSQFITWGANDDLQLLSKLSEKARGHSFNMGVAVAESGQTLQLVAVTLSRITLAVKALRNGRVDQALRSLGAVPKPQLIRRYDGMRRRSREFQLTGKMTTKDVSSMWLEIQYGWKPLLQDVHEGMTAYSRHTNPPRYSRFTVSKSKSSTRKIFPTGSTALMVEQKQLIIKRIIVTQKESLTVARSLGLADPRPIIWEKIPFSFVADWFIPIGSYLDNLATIPFIQASYMVIEHDTIFGQGTGGTDQFNTQNFIGAFSNGSWARYTRSIPGAITVPLPQFKTMDEALSIGHIKNGIALLHQLLK